MRTARQSPDLPPRFSSRRTPPITIVPVQRLRHVVDRQQRDRRRCHRFHLHARCWPVRRGGGSHPHGVLLHHAIHRHCIQRQRVAQRYQLARPLGRHDARDARRGQHIALRHATVTDRVERGIDHPDRAFRHGHPVRFRLAADIDHPGVIVAVEMGEAGHAKRPENGDMDRVLHCPGAK